MFVRLSEPIALQDHDKEVLAQILRVLHRITVTANEQEYRSPVGPAKLSQRFARLLSTRIAAGCGKNQTPAGCSKLMRPALPIANRFSFHSRPLSYLRNWRASLNAWGPTERMQMASLIFLRKPRGEVLGERKHPAKSGGSATAALLKLFRS